MFVPRGPFDLLGAFKGADFVHFYTVGAVAYSQRPALLYDHAALHEFQTSLVPASVAERYLSVYPPQTAIVFAPLSRLPYGMAAIVWALLTAVIYAGVTTLAARVVPLPRALLIAALASFPPFWNLIWYGQTTAMPLLAFGLGGAAILRGWRLGAGMALGVLAIKPQLGLVLAVVLIVGREWRIIAGIAASWLVQFAIVTAVLGLEVWGEYARVISQLPEFRDALEPKPGMLHSLAAVTTALPDRYRMWVWLVISVPVVYVACAVWRGPAATPIKLAILVLASVLVSPHLTIYDATVLALPLLWVGSQLTQDRVPTFVAMVYVLVATLLVPTAKFLPLQASVLVMLWMFYDINRWYGRTGARSTGN